MGVVQRIVAVDAVNAKDIDQIGERVASQFGTQMARERQRVARLQALRREAEAELLALLIQHPKVEPGIVRDKQHIFSDEAEELPHRLLRRQAMF